MSDLPADLSIVIASYETPELLSACLDSVARAQRARPKRSLEVIVVDNGSRDDSVARARASDAAPRVLAFARNRGFAAAMNAGVRLASGRTVLLLNSDVELDAALLDGAMALLDAEPRIGLLGPALVHPDGRAQRSVHVLPGLDSELLGERFARRLRRVEREHPGPPRGWREVEAVRGAVLFVRRELFEKLGPLDEGFFFFLEETDLCARARAAGHAVAFVPSLSARHRLGASSKRRQPTATRIEYLRSLDRALRRHRGPIVAATVRGLRAMRAGVGVLVGLAPALISPRARARVRGRAGLLLWHLRGRPVEPSLAAALRATPRVRDGERADRRAAEDVGGA